MESELDKVLLTQDVGFTQTLTAEELDCLELDSVLDEHSLEENSFGTITCAGVQIAVSSEEKKLLDLDMSMVMGSLRGTSLFLTFPQCNLPIKPVLEKIIAMWNVKFAVVAGELHKDGSPHLHCVIKLKRRMRIKFTDLDKITGKRGNYQNARNIDKCLKYISKDGEWVSHNINLLEYLKNIKEKKSTKAQFVMKIVKEGGSLDDIVDSYPGFAFANKRKIENWIDYYDLKRFKKEKLEWAHALQVLALSPIIDLPSGELICSWLYRNIKKPRSFKQKQLMIYGPPNVGKTSLIMFLETHLKIYHLTTDDYDDNWKNNFYDLAVIDEFRGQKKITWWNKWLQGGTMPLKVRYRAPNKEGNIPTIILSNFNLQECYKNCEYSRLDGMYERLEIVETLNYLEIKE